jgi:hypothetical protein
MRQALLALALLLVLAPAAQAASCQSNADGAWTLPATWTSCNGGVPGAADSASIIGHNVTIAAPTTIAALTINNAFATITFTGSAGTLTTTTFTAIRGTVTGDGTLTVSGTFAKAPGVIQPDADLLTVKNSADLVLDGTSTMTGGAIVVAQDDSNTPGNTLFINGEFRIQAGANAVAFPGSGKQGVPGIRISASGKLIDELPGQTTVINSVDNEGSVQAAAGVFELGNGNDGNFGIEVSSGDYEATAANTLLFTSNSPVTMGSGGSLIGAGELRIASPVIAPDGVDVTVATLTLTGHETKISGAGAYTTQTVNLKGGTLRSTRSLSPAALNAESGQLRGDATITPTAFAKTTTDAFFVREGTDLVLGQDLAFDGATQGVICVANDAGGLPLPSVRLTGQVTLATGMFFTCGETDPTLFVGPGGTLAQAGAVGTTTVGPKLGVDGGTLTIGAGRIWDQGGGGVVLLNGGVLAGGGKLTGRLDNTSGTIKPGASVGTLTVAGFFTQTSGGTIEVEIDGAASFDQLIVDGFPATVDGTVAVVRAQAFTPASSDTFKFLTAQSRSGTFSAVTGGGLPGGAALTVDHLADGARLAVALPPPPTPGQPVIVGVMGVGQTVTCNPGVWGNSPFLTYEWLLDGVPISGQTAPTYTIVPGDAGHLLTCRVTGTNAGGTATATSPPRPVPAPVVATATPTPTPAPTPAPTATPAPPVIVPTAAETKLEKAKPDVVAQAFGLPSARRCKSRRKFGIRLVQPKGVRIKAARVVLDAKSVKVTKSGGRFRATIDLRGFKKGRFTISITITTAADRKIKGARKYRTCVPKPKR